MRVSVVVGALLISSAAFSQASPDQIADALMFVLKGNEEGMPYGASAPIERIREKDRIVYRTRGRIGEVLADYAKPISQCVVQMGKIFHGEDIEPELFDLNKVTSFELKRHHDANLGYYGYITLRGGNAYCFKSECKQVFSTYAANMDKSYRFGEDEQLRYLDRYEKAIEFLRRQCPGKPY